MSDKPAKENASPSNSLLPRVPPLSSQLQEQAKQLAPPHAPGPRRHSAPLGSARRQRPRELDAIDARRYGNLTSRLAGSSRPDAGVSFASPSSPDRALSKSPPSSGSGPRTLAPLDQAASGTPQPLQPPPTPVIRSPLSSEAPPEPPLPPTTPGRSPNALIVRRHRVLHGQRHQASDAGPQEDKTPLPSRPQTAGPPGFMTQCYSCKVDLSQHTAKFCLQCGEARLEKASFSEAFHKIVGSRPSIRKMDLCKLVRHTDGILQSISRGKSKSFRFTTACVQNAFVDIMAEQQKQSACNQGIIIDFFQEFLCHVAVHLDLTMPSLLHGLLEKEDTTQTLNDLDSPVQKDSSSMRRRTIEVMETPKSQRGKSKPVADMCAKCGSKFISNAKFCCECGEKQPEPVKFDKNGFHFFRGTERRLSQGQQVEVDISQRDFEELVRLSKTYHLPIEDVRKKQLEFRDLDTSKDGTLSLSEFTAVVRRQCNLRDDEDVPSHLVDKAWFQAGPGNASAGNALDFESFLSWSCRVGNTEEMLVADPHERYLRSLARTHGLHNTYVDRYYKVFARVQPDPNGFIQEPEFRNLLAVLLDGAKPEDLPEQTLHRMWTELDAHRLGRVSFERFLVWSMENLDS